MIVIEILCLFFAISSISAMVTEDQIKLWTNRIGKDCKYSPLSFVDDTTHENYETLRRFKSYLWKIEMYDTKPDGTQIYDSNPLAIMGPGLYLDNGVRMDINDLINGYFLESTIFEDYVLEKNIHGNFKNMHDICRIGIGSESCDIYRGLSSEEKNFVNKIREISRKFKQFFDFLLSIQPNGNPWEIEIPTNIKICTSSCTRPVDNTCLEVKKVGQ